MAHVPPIEPTDVATKADLASLEERLEVHLTVFVDERLATSGGRWPPSTGTLPFIPGPWPPPP